ncbi:unnamed protein product [Brassicogethes aeneus]|uniref:Uncharacterized protein n=1 Tax=Brassicogethes aeneus TaxID=1431903 RepID=A0A9P0BH37_BRAAE|nr:unnamed protein product [Brassicogethes aeneus]
MDPWITCQSDVVISEIPITLNFEDNFSPSQNDKLPDSEQYLAILEEKLRKIKSDPDVLRQLAEKRESCMQQLMLADPFYEDENIELDTPVPNSHIIRTLQPQKQALNQGEIVELVKYDQLNNENADCLSLDDKSP